MRRGRSPASQILRAICCSAALLLGIVMPVAAGPGVTSPILNQLGAAHFAEPLIATGPAQPIEDQELLQAVGAYERRAQPDDFTSLARFLSAHPQSAWRVALLTNLGISYLHYGYFSRALDA